MNKQIKLIKPYRFKRLSVMGKRVAIARDVLYRIKLKLLNPNQGTLFSASHNGAQSDLNKKGCQCCAKGAILCSFIGNFNKHRVRAFAYNRVSAYPSELLEVFSPNLLDAMETAFENTIRFGWNVYHEGNGHENIGQKILDTFKKYKTPKGRQVAIMNNLIENKGKFVLCDGTIIQ